MSGVEWLGIELGGERAMLARLGMLADVMNAAANLIEDMTGLPLRSAATHHERVGLIIDALSRVGDLRERLAKAEEERDDALRMIDALSVYDVAFGALWNRLSEVEGKDVEDPEEVKDEILALLDAEHARRKRRGKRGGPSR